jgi:hypothetical protein
LLFAGLLSHREVVAVVVAVAVAEQVVVARAAQVRGPVALQVQQVERVRTPRPEELTRVRVPGVSVREEARPIRGVTTRMTQLTGDRRVRRIGRVPTASATPLAARSALATIKPCGLLQTSDSTSSALGKRPHRRFACPAVCRASEVAVEAAKPHPGQFLKMSPMKTPSEHVVVVIAPIARSS